MSLVKPARAVERSQIAIVQTVAGSAFDPSTNWTKFPGTTKRRIVIGDDFDMGANQRITWLTPGWGRVECLVHFWVDELDDYDFGFGVSGVSPTGVFATIGLAFWQGVDYPRVARLAWDVELAAAAWVEPYVKCDGSATASVTIERCVMRAKRLHLEP